MGYSRVNDIILGTGNYDNVKIGNTVSITGDGGNHWHYFGPSYKSLAPRLVTYVSYAEKYERLLKLKNNLLDLEYFKLKKQIEDEYILSYYETRLKNLDIDSFLSVLEERFGNNVILLCHESVNEFCHRRLLADYIELKTGIYIPEVSVSNEGNIKKLIPIRYKNRLKDVMEK